MLNDDISSNDSGFDSRSSTKKRHQISSQPTTPKGLVTPSKSEVSPAKRVQQAKNFEELIKIIGIVHGEYQKKSRDNEDLN